MIRYIKSSVAAAATLLCMGGAHAGFITHLIDFESVDTSSAPFAPLIAEGDELSQSGFSMVPFSNSASAQPGDLIGALVNGSDVPNTCVNITCPTNNPTEFYAALNDSVLYLDREDGLSFTLNSFSAAFVGDAAGLFPGIPGRIIFQGVRASDGAQFAFVGGNLTSTEFAKFTIGAASPLRTTPWSAMYVFGQTCSPAGSCSSFNSDRAQFALDNISLNVIPEPASLALAALGLAGMGAARRRRSA